MDLDAFLQAIVADPHHAAATWLVLADWLEDRDDPRAELVRLMYQPDYHRDLPGADRDERVRQLLASGVGPVTPTLVNSIGTKLVLIPAGVFMMGSPEDEGEAEEHPQHEVEITRPFFLGAYPVTQEEYERVMGANPSCFCFYGDGMEVVKGLDTRQFPVEMVTWDEARAFCETLSNRPEEKAAGRRYHLPSEAQWEYACRGGAVSYTSFHLGKTLESTQSNFHGSYPHGGAPKGPFLGRPSPVGSYPANAFALYDMHGNVCEWCLDWYDKYYYRNSPRKDPQGPGSGRHRVLRGGAWNTLGIFCRSTARLFAPGNGEAGIGFRVCCFLDF
jgi:uncharacterized protein (TIGR02996 family)